MTVAASFLWKIIFNFMEKYCVLPLYFSIVIAYNKIIIMYRVIERRENMSTALEKARFNPFHLVGNSLQGISSTNETIKEVLSVGGLDWEVEKVPHYQEVDGQMIEIPGTSIVRRKDNFNPLGVVSSKSYELIQNDRYFDVLDDIGKERPMEYIAAGTFQGGKRVWLTSKLPTIEIVEHEKFDLYLVFQTAHDGKNSMKVSLTPVRAMCENAMNTAVRDAYRTWNFPHYNGINERIKQVGKTFNMVDLYIQKYQEYMEKLLDKSVTSGDLEYYVDELFPLKDEMEMWQIEALEDKRQHFLSLYKATDVKKYQGTGYGVLLATSDYSTHPLNSEAANFSMEGHFSRIINGHPMIDKVTELLAA